MILGFMFLWIGPGLFGSIMWLWQLGNTMPGTSSPWTWGACFAVVALVSIPVMFLLERATRGKFLEGAAENLESDNLMTVGLRGRLAAGAVVIELCLWGPRMLTAGGRRLREAREVERFDREPAAVLLATMLTREEGWPAPELFAASGLPEEDVHAAIAYLLFHGWIDQGKGGRRCWVTSEARRLLDGGGAR